MSEVTHQQAELLLKLYDLRREPRLRQARAWYVEKFTPVTSPEEFMTKYPPGGEESTNLRMVTSFWEMAASIVNRGLIDDEFFFENTGEPWVVWEKVKPLIPAWREMFKSPGMMANLEKLAARMEAYWEKRAPGSVQVRREFFRRMAQPAAKAAGE
jgi:hypothetical protein